jgi:AraC-like DNA-binding protein
MNSGYGEAMTTRDHHHAGPITAFRWTASVLDGYAEVTHTAHVLSFLVAGSIQIQHGGPVQIEAGSVTLVPAGVPHRVLGGTDVEIWLLSFCAGCLSLDEHQPLMAPFYSARLGALPVVEIAENRRGRLVRLLADLREELETHDATSLELSRCALMLLLGEVRRGHSRLEQQPVAGSLVGDALAFIQRRCLQPISLRDVAAAVHRTPAHVATQVKGATGYTVGEWITAGRVAEAAARLTHTDDRVAEIAEHVGWRDTTHFIRQFKKAFGATPAAWRRTQRQGG